MCCPYLYVDRPVITELHKQLGEAGHFKSEQ